MTDFYATSEENFKIFSRNELFLALLSESGKILLPSPYDKNLIMLIFFSSKNIIVQLIYATSFLSFIKISSKIF